MRKFFFLAHDSWPHQPWTTTTLVQCATPN